MTVFVRELDETSDQILNQGDVFKEMKVIHHENEVFVNKFVDFVGQRDDQTLDALLGREAGQRVLRFFSKVWEDRGDGRDEIGCETLQVAVQIVKREPADFQIGARGQIREKRRFTVTRRSRDEDQFLLEHPDQFLQQTRTGQ